MNGTRRRRHSCENKAVKKLSRGRRQREWRRAKIFRARATNDTAQVPGCGSLAIGAERRPQTAARSGGTSANQDRGHDQQRTPSTTARNHSNGKLICSQGCWMVGPRTKVLKACEWFREATREGQTKRSVGSSLRVEVGEARARSCSLSREPELVNEPYERTEAASVVHKFRL